MVPRDSANYHLPIYPKAFITAGKFSRQLDRVFMAMPFNARHSDDLWEVVEAICNILKLNVRRGDSSVYPHIILAETLSVIEEVEIIIVDDIRLNINVLYDF